MNNTDVTLSMFVENIVHNVHCVTYSVDCNNNYKTTDQIIFTKLAIRDSYSHVNTHTLAVKIPLFFKQCTGEITLT